MEYKKIKNKHGVVNTVTIERFEKLMKSGEGYSEVRATRKAAKKKDES